MDYKTPKLDIETRIQLVILALDELKLKTDTSGIIKTITELSKSITNLSMQISDLNTRIRNIENQQLSQNLDILASDMKALKLKEKMKWKVWQ